MIRAMIILDYTAQDPRRQSPSCLPAFLLTNKITLHNVPTVLLVTARTSRSSSAAGMQNSHSNRARLPWKVQTRRSRACRTRMGRTRWKFGYKGPRCRSTRLATSHLFCNTQHSDLILRLLGNFKRFGCFTSCLPHIIRNADWEYFRTGY